MAGSLAAVYYSQQVSSLEAQTRQGRQDLQAAVEDVDRAGEEALEAIRSEVDAVRDSLSQTLPVEDPSVGGARLLYTSDAAADSSRGYPCCLRSSSQKLVTCFEVVQGSIQLFGGLVCFLQPFLDGLAIGDPFDLPKYVYIPLDLSDHRLGTGTRTASLPPRFSFFIGEPMDGQLKGSDLLAFQAFAAIQRLLSVDLNGLDDPCPARLAARPRAMVGFDCPRPLRRFHSRLMVRSGLGVPFDTGQRFPLQVFISLVARIHSAVAPSGMTVAPSLIRPAAFSTPRPYLSIASRIGPAAISAYCRPVTSVFPCLKPSPAQDSRQPI
jgi:hypothetical protein